MAFAAMMRLPKNAQHRSSHMTSRNNKEEGAFDVTEVGLVATGAAIGGPAGAALGLGAAFVAKVPKALKRGRATRQARFIERVIHYLEEDDPAGAADFIASKSDTAEFADTLERGYEAMRRALDPATEECICLLTADHARQGRPADRRFVRAAALLEVCDLSMLRTLNLITTAYTAMGEESSHRLLYTCKVLSATATVPPFLVIVAYSGDEQVGMSGIAPAPKNIRRLLIDLAHYDYGDEWPIAIESTQPVGLPVVGSYAVCNYWFPREHHETILALHRYLAPVRRMMTTADPDDEVAVLLQQTALLERAVHGSRDGHVP